MKGITNASGGIPVGSVSKIYRGTVTAGAWVGDAAPYTAEVAISGILSSDTPDVDLVASDEFADAEAQIEAWGYVYKAVTASGSITFYATAKPDVSIPVQIRAVRK